MANDSKQRIREHLAKSSGGEIDFDRLPQNYDPQQNSLSSNQKSRQEHIERSLGNYNLNSSNKQTQKSRIMQHIKITRG